MAAASGNEREESSTKLGSQSSQVYSCSCSSLPGADKTARHALAGVTPADGPMTHAIRDCGSSPRDTMTVLLLLYVPARCGLLEGFPKSNTFNMRGSKHQDVSLVKNKDLLHCPRAEIPTNEHLPSIARRRYDGRSLLTSQISS
jgi:hypothetical protein